MDSVNAWTGRTACALQAALRLSNEAFAERLGIGVRTVAGWHQKPKTRPQSEMQRVLDTALEQAPPGARARFAELLAPPPDAVHKATDAEDRLTADPNISGALVWLDDQANWEPGTARRRVASQLATIDLHQLRRRHARRGQVNQRQVADSLDAYYGDKVDEHGQYRATYGPAGRITTSVLTHPDWLDLDCPLIPPADAFTLSGATSDLKVALDDLAADHAVQRLAETLAAGVRVVDKPLFQLTGLHIRKGSLAGSAGVWRFMRYALTMDLLEGELLDAIAAEEPTVRGSLPLRDAYLPSLPAVLDVPNRLCAGGALALCALARPASVRRGPADYVLLVQERSGQVVNAAHRLAVIPKGFHQPMTDYRADVHVSATLLREMEEELFGRDDIDNTVGDERRADPMHPSLLSDPMRWLLDEPDRLRMECTGFGLNLVSGNYEFASLIVIEDDEFWMRYGGSIIANWEAIGLRQYSSLDPDSLTELIGDQAWSNEGLFALLQGLRRLSRIGRERVNIPEINWEIR